jgi:hypothetical protein
MKKSDIFLTTRTYIQGSNFEIRHRRCELQNNSQQYRIGKWFKKIKII